jgi:hypothetical protein
MWFIADKFATSANMRVFCMFPHKTVDFLNDYQLYKKGCASWNLIHVGYAFGTIFIYYILLSALH